MWKVDDEKMQEIIDEHEQITEQLAKIYRQKCQGSIVRSRIKWFEEGEKKTQNILCH